MFISSGLCGPTKWRIQPAGMDCWPALNQRPGPASIPGWPESQVARIQNCLKHLQGSAGGNDDGHWLALINVIDEIVGEGVPPSNREVRELLLPMIDELPERDDYPAGFRLVLREIDRFLATRSAPARTSIAHGPSAEVKEAARLLGGKSIVLIGGNRRREAQESLRRALGLKDLVWIETKEHQAIDAFEPLIARADVALGLTGHPLVKSCVW